MIKQQRKTGLLVMLLAVAVSLFAGCAGTSPATTTTTTTINTSTPATSPTGTAAYSITIMVNNQQQASLTLTDLKKLAQVTSSSQEAGPTLLSVLKSVGVQTFNQVTINGYNQGRTASATTTLQNAQVTDNVMLALVNRGTAKLTGSGVTTQIIDISQIIVN